MKNEAPQTEENPREKDFEKLDPEYKDFVETIESNADIETPSGEIDHRPAMLQVMKDTLEATGKRDKKALGTMDYESTLQTFYGYGFTASEIRDATMTLGQHVTRNLGSTERNFSKRETETITRENFRHMGNSPRGFYSNARDLVLLAVVDTELRSKHLTPESEPSDEADKKALAQYKEIHDKVLNHPLAPDWIKEKAGAATKKVTAEERLNERHDAEAAVAGKPLWTQYQEALVQEAPKGQQFEVIMETGNREGAFRKLTEAFPDVVGPKFNDKTRERLNAKARFQGWLSAIEKVLRGSSDPELTSAFEVLKKDF